MVKWLTEGPQDVEGRYERSLVQKESVDHRNFGAIEMKSGYP